MKKKFKKGKDYFHNDIRKFVEDNEEEYTMTEYGINLVGENFIAVSHVEKDSTISFVLTGTVGAGYIYTCIYTSQV